MAGYGTGSYGRTTYGMNVMDTDDIKSLIPSRTLRNLKNIYGRGMKAVEKWNGDLTVAILRKGDDGYAPVADLAAVPVISLGMFNAATSETPANQGASELLTRGELKTWSPMDIRVDDRFRWDGALCQIRSAPPDKLDTIRVFQFDIIQGSPS